MTRKVVTGQGSLAHTFKKILNLLQENIKHSIESVVGDIRGLCFFVLRVTAHCKGVSSSE